MTTAVPSPRNVLEPGALVKGIAATIAGFLAALALGFAIEAAQPEAPAPAHPTRVVIHDETPITDRQETLTDARVGRADIASRPVPAPPRRPVR